MNVLPEPYSFTLSSGEESTEYVFKEFDPYIPVAIYIRISQDRTGEGVGVKRQLEDCKAFAELQRHTVVKVFNDNDKSAYVTSGRKGSGNDRPGFQALQKMAQAKIINGVIAWKMDRLWRSVRDLDNLITIAHSDNSAFKIYTVTSGMIDPTDASGLVVARILAAVAQGEVAIKAERQSRAQEQAFADKKFSGGPVPMGYALGPTPGSLIVVEDIAVVLRHVAKMLLLPSNPPRGEPWSLNRATAYIRKNVPDYANTSPQTVKHVLTGPAIAARRNYLPVAKKRAGEKEGTSGLGSWEAILDDETWYALKGRLNNPVRAEKKGRPAQNSLLAGVLVCGVCGQTLTYSKVSYKCPSKPRGCASLSVGTKGVEKTTQLFVLIALASDAQGGNDKYLHGLIGGQAAPAAAEPVARPDYAAELADINSRRAMFTAMAGETGSVMRPEEYLSIMKALTKREMEILEAQSEASKAPVTPAPQIQAAKDSWRKLMKDNSDEAKAMKNAVFRDMFEMIVVYPATPGLSSGSTIDGSRLSYRFFGLDPFIPLNLRTADYKEPAYGVTFIEDESKDEANKSAEASTVDARDEDGRRRDVLIV